MLQYNVIEIFTSEKARWKGRPINQAVVQYVHDLKIAARCLVTRAIDGCYESGEVATGRLEVLSYNMPLRIAIVLPSSEIEKVLPEVEAMVIDGIVAVHCLEVVSHKTRKQLIPNEIKVKDIMTPDPQKVLLTTPLDQVVRLLLSSIFTGVPVIDDANRPVGVITQGDLIYKGKMPMRLGMLAESSSEKLDAVLSAIASKSAREVMATPVVAISQDQFVKDAVDLMLKKRVKRLPVLDEDGKLKGMLSRLDIFRTIMQEAPDWNAFKQQNITVNGVRTVSDIMRRDTHAVLPETPVDEIIRMIDSNDIQRVTVVDKEGRFLGLISDRDLLVAFSPDFPDGIWDQFLSLVPFSERGKRHRELKERLQAKTAAAVMNTDIITVQETTPIDTAIAIMTEKGLKRLPVLDSERKFKGMISRDSLLRTGFEKKIHKFK
jgi:CBS domain-containing protein/PII-like signaling protein